MTRASSAHHNEERQARKIFACEYADSDYRFFLAAMYAHHQEVNNEFFGGVLMEPHIEFGRTAHCSVGHCEPTTGYGGRLQMTLNRGLMNVQRGNANTPLKPQWVRRPWPARGIDLFSKDLVLRFTVRQYVLEVLEKEEAGYRGYGPLFQKEANRIGISLGLAPVSVRRRPGHENDGPPCIGWPHCVRTLSDYDDDITEELYLLAAGTTQGSRSSPLQNMGILELVQFLLIRDRAKDAQRIIGRHLEWLERFHSHRFPIRRRVEDGKEDVDGSPLGTVTFDPSWLQWNWGTVAKIAQSVKMFRSFGDLPILADALEEAGCCDDRILRHLRAEMIHDSRCWVLRLLLALENRG